MCVCAYLHTRDIFLFGHRHGPVFFSAVGGTHTSVARIWILATNLAGCVFVLPASVLFVCVYLRVLCVFVFVQLCRRKIFHARKNKKRKKSVFYFK